MLALSSGEVLGKPIALLLIHWIDIYPVDSAIQLLKSWGQMVSYCSGTQVLTTRCKLTFFTRLCRLSQCMTLCKHGLQSYSIYIAFCNFHNPFLYHFMLVKNVTNVQFDNVWIILMCFTVFHSPF